MYVLTILMVMILQYIHVSNHVYTLNVQNVICLLYLNKAGKKIRIIFQGIDQIQDLGFIHV